MVVLLTCCDDTLLYGCVVMCCDDSPLYVSVKCLLVLLIIFSSLPPQIFMNVLLLVLSFSGFQNLNRTSLVVEPSELVMHEGTSAMIKVTYRPPQPDLKLLMNSSVKDVVEVAALSLVSGDEATRCRLRRSACFLMFSLSFSVTISDVSELLLRRENMNYIRN